MTVKFTPPRHMSQPVAKAKPAKREIESARRKQAGASHRMADRRRGWHRGARR